MKELIKIQSELKAPKNQRNGFGKYMYRSCEDILEALKPLLKEQGCFLLLSDTIEEIGGCLMVKATAIIEKGADSISVTSYAGIDLQKKGMDSAQCFGSSSSYARKYALNGLFAIDDTKDSDSIEVKKEAPKQPVSKPKPKAVSKDINTLDTAKDLFKKMIIEPMFTKSEIAEFRGLINEEVKAGTKPDDLIKIIEIKYNSQFNKSM